MAETICVLCGEPWDVHHINHDAPFHVRGLFRAGKGCESCRGAIPTSKPDIEELGGVLLNGGDDDDTMTMICALEDGTTDKDWTAEWEAAELKSYDLATCAGCEKHAEYEAGEVWGLWDSEKNKWVPAIAIFAGDFGERQGGRFNTDNRKVSIEAIKAGTGEAFGHTITLETLDSDWDFEQVLGKTLCADCRDTCDGQTAAEYEQRENPATGLMAAMLVEGSVKSCGVPLYKNAAHDKFVSDTYDEGSSFFNQDLGRWGKRFCSDCWERLPSCNYCGNTWDFEDSTVEFIEDDDHRCHNCTSFTKCDTCDEWAETLDDNSECQACAARYVLKAVGEATITDLEYPDGTLMGPKHVCDEPDCEEIATKRLVKTADPGGPLFTCDEHEGYAAVRIMEQEPTTT